MNARRRIPLALRIAAKLLPPDAREDVLGDLVDMWDMTLVSWTDPVRLGLHLARRGGHVGRAAQPKSLGGK